MLVGPELAAVLVELEPAGPWPAAVAAVVVAGVDCWQTGAVINPEIMNGCE